MRLVKIVAGFLAAVMLTLSVMSGVGFGDLVSAGGEIYPETGLMFTLLENGTYSVSCPENNREQLTGEVVIPPQRGGIDVTEISERGFYECTNLVSVTIPDSVTLIGGAAFADCENLSFVKMSNNVTSIGVKAFSGCKNLSDITLPQSVTEINDYAFSGCNLTTVTINKNIEKISNGAFSSCENLVAINVDGDNEYYCSEDGVLFNKDKTELSFYPAAKKVEAYTIPKNVTTIGMWAFSGHDELVSIELHDSITAIGWQAFSGCKNLRSVTIPESVTDIGECAFGYCESLTSIVIPNGISRIKAATFSGCKKLVSVTLPDSVTFISEGAFGYCESLRAITLPKNVWYIDVGAFRGCISLTDFKIPNGIKKITGDLFMNCSALNSIFIPAGIEKIEDHAFDGAGIKDIYYGGTKNQWDQIVIEENNNVLSNAIVHYNSLESEYPDTSNPGDTNTTTEELFGLLSFSLLSDGTYLATCPVENKDKLVGDIVFPSKYNDIPITTIELSELGGCNNITSVIIPEGVCHFVIDLCENLKTVNLPSTIEYISSDTILGCSNLIEVNVSEDNLKYCSEDGIVFSKDKTALILFPAGKNKDVYAIPESVTEIESRAFGFNQKVRTISIPAGVTKISDGLAEYSEKLEAIMVDVDNGAFCSFDGVLFSKDMTRLLEYPPAKADKAYTVPDGIIQIREISNNNLTALVVPDGVSDIGAIKCTNLAKVTLPKSLEKYPRIYVSVKNTEIVYGGTMAEWNDLVENASEYMKKRYADFIIRCSDSNPGGDTSEPDTSDPNTSDPDDGNTSKPDTSDPDDTSKPNTSEPGTGDTSGDNSGNTSVPDTNGGFSTNSNISAGAPSAHIRNSLSELIDALMSTEEKEQYKNGANVNIILEVKDISGQVSSSDVRAVEAVLGNLSGYRVGKYLDLTLLKTVGKTEKTVIRSRNPIAIVIDIPQELLGYGREYAVICVHNGEASVLNDKDSNDATVTIDTDRFSTYVLIYKERLLPAESNPSSGESSSDGGLIGDNTSSGGDTTTSLPSNEEDEKIPYTGIQSYTLVYLTAGLISLLVFLLLCFFTGKNGMTESEKNKAFSKLIAWGKRGGRIRSVIALAAIFFVLTFYYGIGMKTSER